MTVWIRQHKLITCKINKNNKIYKTTTKKQNCVKYINK